MKDESRQLQKSLREASTETPTSLRPVASPAKPQRRHVSAVICLILGVLIPTVCTAAYLWGTARDQYVTRIGFSVRSAQAMPALDVLGGLGQLAGADSTDSEILYDFIQSEQLVRGLRDRIDLVKVYGCTPEQKDFVFCHKPDAAIEDLTHYWKRMTRVTYDAGAGIIEVEARAFDPGSALEIANEIFNQSSEMINDLSLQARTDATQYASEEVDLSIVRLKQARRALANFRTASQVIDPEADIQGQMGVITSMQSQLTEALIDRGLLELSAASGDPRVTQLTRKISVIEDQIELQRGRFGLGEDEGGHAYAHIIGTFEELTVDLEFAQQSYLSALSALETATAEARRQSRYLAAHIRPTLAERAEYPMRLQITALVAFFAFFTWAILFLVYYSLRDRK
jgi:capsular polysaccharide transport system permease protein